MHTVETNTIVVISNSQKKKQLLEHTSKKQLTTIKYMTLEELFSNLMLKPKTEAIYYLMKDMNLSYALANIYLKNIPHVTHIEANSYENVKKLLEIKKYLKDNQLLEDNKAFVNYLKGKTILIENETLTKEQKSILKALEPDTHIEIKETTHESYLHSLYAFETIDEEIAFIAADIINKIESGVPIQNIYLTNVTDEYVLPLHRIFQMYEIPLEESGNHTLYGTPITKEWLSNLGSPFQAFEIIENKYKTEEDKQIYNQLLQIYNRYIMVPQDEYWRICIEEACKETSILLPKKQNAVRIKDFKTSFQADDYVYILGMNQENIPVTKQDEDYLNDAICHTLNIDTTKEKNKQEKKNVIHAIDAIPNAILTYKKKTPFGTYYPSSILSYLNVEEKTPEISYQYADTWNKIKLAKLLDQYTQYNEKSNTLEVLYAHYPNLPYNTYDNQYTQISKEQLKEYLENKLVLSYTSIDRFYRCRFRYYISNILKLDTYEETFAQTIGNLFHYILSIAFRSDFDFESEWEKYHQEKAYNAKETFFLKKLKQELLFVIETIQEQNRNSELLQEEYEQKIFKSISGDLKITFMGIVDKIKYKKEDGVLYAAIIDYKTGTLETNLNQSIYGIGMQLPVYLYLLKNKPGCEKVKVLGFYLQKMVQNEPSNDENKDYIKLKKDNLRLEGYSIDDPEILCKLDNTYQDSRMIKGLKTSSKGFYAYSKIMNEEKMEQLTTLVDEKIKEAANKIENADFKINPKQIGEKLIGCEFCSYHDLCFQQAKDIVYLKEYKKLEFLGGESSCQNGPKNKERQSIKKECLS